MACNGQAWMNAVECMLALGVIKSVPDTIKFESPNYMTVPAAIRELEKIKMIRGHATAHLQLETRFDIEYNISVDIF